MPSRIAVLLAVGTALIVAPSAAQAATLRAPGGLGPNANASVQTVPPFTWDAVPGAQAYDFQLAADRGFGSIVDRGKVRTRNTAATVVTAVADGTYYWRVRAIGANDKAGRWTSPRPFVKAWVATPTLEAPVDDGLSIDWPTKPAVLRWSPVPYAAKYEVIVATDEKFGNPVVGSIRRPLETQGTVYAVKLPLNNTRYFWRVTPIDTGNFRGRESRTGSFKWNWPTDVAQNEMTVEDSDGDSAVFDPLLRWREISGAVKYEVEINPTQQFTGGSTVFRGSSTGNQFSPPEHLPNNVYDWRVRSIDADGNAGQWNQGPAFRKNFDAEITSVRVGDDTTDDTGPARRTAVPFASWKPVPGAVTYRVQVKQHAGRCGWLPGENGSKSTTTPNHFWAGSGSWGTQATAYCMRIAALDSFGNSSRWTYVNGEEGVAFTYDPNHPRATAGQCGVFPSVTSWADDLAACVPAETPVAFTPYFRWRKADCAAKYDVRVAHDDELTNVRDSGTTTGLMWAPITRYLDETSITPYHVTVTPIGSDGRSCGSTMSTTFKKRSVAPERISPAEGSNAPVQQLFRWKHVPGAHHYQLQVATDPNFGKLLDDVKTASSAFASQKAYPPHTKLYWRVRAYMHNGVRTGALSWPDQPWSFQRDLPMPEPDSAPAGGENIPVLSWKHVQGAISYDMHVDQSDGTARDFTDLRSRAFTPTLFYGTGVWRWKVRARFPGNAFGPYFDAVPFVRQLNAPQQARVNVGRNRMLFTWQPDAAAHRYRIQLSTSDSFTRIADQELTELTSWAPKLDKLWYRAGGPVWWRVAVVDGGNNVGAYTTGRVTIPKQMTVSAKGLLRRGRRGSIVVTVKDSKNQPVSAAALRTSGAGSKTAKARTGRKGTGTLRIRATKRGTVKIRVIKRGWLDGTISVKVR